MKLTKFVRPAKKCPTPDCPNMLSAYEIKMGYQCPTCTRREESPY